MHINAYTEQKKCFTRFEMFDFYWKTSISDARAAKQQTGYMYFFGQKSPRIMRKVELKNWRKMITDTKFKFSFFTPGG